MRTAIRKHFDAENKDIIQTYELEHEAIRKKIEERYAELENKLLRESGIRGYDSLFNDNFVDNEEDDDEKKDKDNDDDKTNDNGLLIENHGTITNEEHIKFEHKHLHKHYHKHIYNHRHIHYHEEDANGKNAHSYTQTHTLAHTITHTHTKLQIKRKII